MKKGRVKNAILEYDRLQEKHEVFYMSDLMEVYDISKKQDIFDLIGNALKVGFVVGRRYEKRQQKAKKGKE